MHFPAAPGSQEEVGAHPGHEGEELGADKVHPNRVKLTRPEFEEVHSEVDLDREEEILNLQVLRLPQHHKMRAAVPEPSDLIDISPIHSEQIRTAFWRFSNACINHYILICNPQAMATPAPEQLNLKVKSQVTLCLLRTAKRSFSKSRIPPSSRN